MAKRKCTQCGERQPKEQMLVRGLVAFCNSECEAEHRNKASKAARPKKSKTKQNITAGKETIVSNKIRESANGEQCALRLSPGCEHTGTVVWCHLNTVQRGMGKKSPEPFGIYGCSYCHRELDANRVHKDDELRAFKETLFKLIKKGLLVIPR